MSSSRRDFIKTASLFAAGTFLPLGTLSKAKMNLPANDKVKAGQERTDSKEYFTGATATRQATSWT